MYVHWPSHKYPIGCSIFGWSKCQWHGYSTHQKVPKETCKSHKVVTSAIAVFEISVSKALNIGEIDEKVFQILQELHIIVINELSNVDHNMEAEARTQSQKSLLEEINEK